MFRCLSSVKSLACSLFFVFLTAAQETTWPQFGGPSRDFSLPYSTAKWKDAKELWRQPLGDGTSGIVGDNRRLFTMYSVPSLTNKDEGEEFVVAIDAATGKTIWQHGEKVERLKGQESFRGDAIRPQATPALAEERLFTLGYTGLLTCFTASDGKVTWRQDLVKDYHAKAVQFGFSASPLVTGDKLIVHVGGKEAAVIALNCATGAVLWKSESAEPSYATPVLLTTAGSTQVVQVTRDNILGLDLESGKTLWTYSLPEAGLTNVPTPVILDDGKILISGQGALGTRTIAIKRIGERFEATELWSYSKVKGFYCNTIQNGKFAVCAFDDFVGALDLKDGKELWRIRGHKDSNFIRLADGLLSLREDGRLSLCDSDEKGFTTRWSAETLRGRTWTAPTLMGRSVYVRNEAEIVALTLVE